MKTICIDIDGTITDPYFFVKYLNELTGKKIKESEYVSQNWNDVYGEEFYEIYNNFDKDYGYIYSEANLVDGAKEVIENFYNYGNNIFFVTARSEYVKDITVDWMKSKGLDDFEVIYLGCNSKKLETAKNLNANIFIEDDADNAIKLANEGVNVVLMDANYNKGIEHKNIFRVYNWDEINLLITSMC